MRRMDTRIPIYNLYHLLCYAWDRLDELDLVDVSSTEPPRDTLNLLGRVLSNGVKSLIRRGFDRGYREQQAELAGIRGGIALSPTIRKQLPRYGRAECIFDELEYDTPANRIIRATLTTLIRSQLLEEGLGHEIGSLRQHFREVREIRATVADCRRVVIHRNNRHYGFLLDLCELILSMVLPDETGQGAQFRDFARDHQAMARLFEQFVRNFYQHHQAECGVSQVRSIEINWDGYPDNEASQRIWPTMRTDICLQRANGPLVIDCKFYADPLRSYYEKEGLHSSNLYQIFTYVQNLATVRGWERVSGMLLYAENGSAFDVGYTVLGHHLRAATVNLNVDWPEIHQRLVSLIAKQ